MSLSSVIPFFSFCFLVSRSSTLRLSCHFLSYLPFSCSIVYAFSAFFLSSFPMSQLLSPWHVSCPSVVSHFISLCAIFLLILCYTLTNAFVVFSFLLSFFLNFFSCSFSSASLYASVLFILLCCIFFALLFVIVCCWLYKCITCDCTFRSMCHMTMYI